MWLCRAAGKDQGGFQRKDLSGNDAIVMELNPCLGLKVPVCDFLQLADRGVQVHLWRERWSIPPEICQRSHRVQPRGGRLTQLDLTCMEIMQAGDLEAKKPIDSSLFS